jgi:hypothetical protein
LINEILVALEEGMRGKNLLEFGKNIEFEIRREFGCQRIDLTYGLREGKVTEKNLISFSPMIFTFEAKLK